MTQPRHARLAVCGSLAIAAACLLLLAAEARAQSPVPGRRSGGLLPTRETPSVSGGQTRDEMLRRFGGAARRKHQAGVGGWLGCRLARRRSAQAPRERIDA